MDLHIRGEIRAYFKHSIEYGLENLKPPAMLRNMTKHPAMLKKYDHARQPEVVSFFP